MILQKTQTFFSTIKNNKYLSYENANVTATIQKKKKKKKKKGKQKALNCQRDLLGLLVSASYTLKKPVDIEKAMSQLLAPVPLYHYHYALQMGLSAILSKVSYIMH